MASIRRNEETVTATIEQHSAGTRGRNIAVAVPVVAIGIIVPAIAFVVLSVVGLVLGLVLTAVATIVRVRTFGTATDRRIVDAFTTMPAESVPAAAGFRNLAAGLGASIGVEVDDLRVLDDPGCNLLVVDDGKGHPVVVVTTGMLAALSRVELEGVVARALVQIRQGDAAAVVDELAMDRAPDIKVVRSLIGGPSVLDDPDRDVLLDRAAVAVTRYPPGLLGALEVCRRSGTAVAGADPATTPLWIVDPSGAASLDERIEVLGLL